MITENKSNKAIAFKFHRQFAHPTPDKLTNLINNAGIPWSSNNELKEEIQKSHLTVPYAKYTGKKYRSLR